MKDKIVVIQFPIWEYNVNDLATQFKAVQQFLQEKGYDWDVVLIPRNCDWTEMDREDLENVRDCINKILEDKPDDSDAQAGAGSEISS